MNATFRFQMILHMDMDAFFAAVEQRDHPELAGRPLVVGGSSKRSVVATASYEARQFGIHSAMPIFMAKERCRDLIIVSPDKPKYAAVSHHIMSLIGKFTPLVEPVSIDEAFLDVTGCERLFGSVEEICAAIRQTIKEEVGLTCSIGASHLKFLAKIASDMNKPDGVHIVHPSDAPGIIETLPIKKIPGVGKRAMGLMQKLGIVTLGDVNRIPLHILEKKFGKFAQNLQNFARGIDPSKVDADHHRKSISSESTLENDTDETAVLKQQLLFHSQRVARELRALEIKALNTTIKVKFSDFSHITRQTKFMEPICSSTAIYNEACLLLGKINLNQKVRLLGVGVSSFSTPGNPVQMELFYSPNAKDKKWAALDRAVDNISLRFGGQTITAASLK